jgi:hypothetical protein
MDQRLVLRRVAIYRVGVCEWAQRYTVPDLQTIPSIAFAQDVHDVMAYFASIYDKAATTAGYGSGSGFENAEEVRLGRGCQLIPPEGVRRFTSRRCCSPSLARMIARRRSAKPIS